MSTAFLGLDVTHPHEREALSLIALGIMRSLNIELQLWTRQGVRMFSTWWRRVRPRA